VGPILPGEEVVGDIPSPSLINTELGGDGGVSCRPGNLGRVAITSVTSGVGFDEAEEDRE